MTRYLLALLLALPACVSRAQSGALTEYDFLRLPVSAHAAAMGGDNVTMADDDLLMLFHNPALLIGATPGTVALQYMNHGGGTNSAAAAYNMVFDERWNVAAAVRYMGYGTMQQRDAQNTDLGTFTATDLAVSATLGYELLRNVAGGVTLRYVYGKIAGYTSMAVAADLGLSLYLPETEWSLGLVVKNLGGQVEAFDEEYGSLPLDVQVGVSKRLTGTPLRLTATLVDMGHTGYKFMNHVALGAELLFSPEIYVAGGYNFRRASEMKSPDGEGNMTAHGAGLSLGAGLNLERFRVNVAYTKYHAASSGIIANVAFTL